MKEAEKNKTVLTCVTDMGKESRLHRPKQRTLNRRINVFLLGDRQNNRQAGLATAQVSSAVGRDGRPGMLAQVVEEVEEEDFEPSLDPLATAALARAITDSEDEGTGGTPSIPNLSKEPSIDNSDDGELVEVLMVSSSSSKRMCNSIYLQKGKCLS